MFNEHLIVNVTTQCNVCIYLAPTSIIYSSQRLHCCCGHIGQCCYSDSLVGVKTNWISVLFSLKGMNHMVNLVNVARVVWCATVWLTVMPSFSDITDVSPVGHSFKTNICRKLLFHVTQYGDIIGWELNLDENCLIGSGSRTQNLPSSWTKVDKD